MVVVAVLATVIAGCANGSRLVEESVVRVAVDSPLTTITPSATGTPGSASSAVAWLTRDHFFTYDADLQPVPDGGFGSATILPGDGFDVQYTLAGSAVWSDGVPVSAADLVLAWVAASGALDALVEPLDRFEAPRVIPLADPAVFPTVSEDGRAVTVYFGSEIPGWQQLLDPQIPAHVLGSLAFGLSDAAEASDAVVEAVLSKDADALAALGAAWNTAFDADQAASSDTALVSSGPYVVREWTESLVTLVANPDYQGSRQPLVETIELVTIEDPLAMVSALANDDVDIIAPSPSPEVQTSLLSIDGATVLTGSDTAIEHLDLQIEGGRSGVFDDARVREAFLLTVPRQQIVTELFGELFEDAAPQSSFVVDPTSPDYADIVSTNGSDRYAEPDLDAAAALLAEAQVVSPDVCVLYEAGDPNRVREFELIAASAEQAGFVVSDCSVDDVPAALGKAGAYDAALFAWNAPLDSTAWITDVYSSGGSTNLTGYESSAVDSLVGTLAVTAPGEERVSILTQIDGELWADAYGVPLFQHPSFTAFGSGVTGVARSNLAPGLFWNATDWDPLAEE